MTHLRCCAYRCHWRGRWNTYSLQRERRPSAATAFRPPEHL